MTLWVSSFLTCKSPAKSQLSIAQVLDIIPIMANPLDTDAGSELFSSYEAELKLVQADLSQKLDQITELSGEPRKSAIRLAERSLDEANELVRKYIMPSFPAKVKFSY